MEILEFFGIQTISSIHSKDPGQSQSLLVSCYWPSTALQHSISTMVVKILPDESQAGGGVPLQQPMMALTYADRGVLEHGLKKKS